MDSDTSPLVTTLRGMLRIATPMIIIQVANTVMHFTDAWMVAPLGQDALAAVLPAGLIWFVPIAFLMGLLGSVNTFVSQSLGKRDLPACGHYAWQGIFFALVSGLLLLLLFPLAGTIFAWFGHEPAVQHLEVIYFQITLFQSTPFLVLIAISRFFVGIHRPAVLAVWAVLGTILNVALNYFLIYGAFGFPRLGLAGAALGTVIATAVQAAALAVHFLLPATSARYATRRPKWDFKAQTAMLRIGIPAGLQSGFDILSWGVVLVWLVGGFGTAALAATTIAVRFMHLAFLPPIGLGMALTAVVGRAIGVGRPDLAASLTRSALIASMIFMGTASLVFVTFRSEWIRIFSSAPEVIAIGSQVLILVAIFQVFDAMNIIFNYALQGAGDTRWPAAVTAILCIGVFVLGGIWVVRAFPGLGPIGPWITGTVYICLLGILMALRWTFGPWRRIDIFSPPASSAG